jgi:SOS-response transcriptional repressor LexA
MFTNENKENFSKVLKKAIGVNRSITDFAKECQVARPYISKFLNCKLDKEPSSDIIRKFASVAANNVQEIDLLCAAGYPLDDIDKFNILFKPVVEAVDPSALIKTNSKLLSYYESSKNKNLSPVQVPVLSFIDPNNIISPDNENVIAYEYISNSSDYKSEKCFYYIADDKSMINSKIDEGDMLLIVPNKEYKHNDIVLIKTNENIFIRRYKKINNIHLFQAENSAFDSFAFSNVELKNSSIKVIGIVEHIKIITNL